MTTPKKKQRPIKAGGPGAWALLGILALSAIGQPAIAAPAAPLAPGEGRLTAVLFGDYYDVAASSNGQMQGLNGTWLRKIYAAYDRGLAHGLAVRLGVEADGGDYRSVTASALPYVKDAALRWGYADGQSLDLGLIDSGAISFVEDQWGLRSVERTPLDLQGWVSTRDEGVSAEGALGPVAYHLGYGNGMVPGWDSSGGLNQKRMHLALEAPLGAGWVAWMEGELSSSPVGDFGPDPAGSRYDYTLQAFAGWKAAAGRAGFLYARQVLVTPSTDGETVKELVSAYGVVTLLPWLGAYARVDHLLWGTEDKAGISYLDLAPQRSTLAIVGLDLPLGDGVNLQPNVELAYYQNDQGGPVAGQDVMPRLTFVAKY